MGLNSCDFCNSLSFCILLFAISQYVLLISMSMKFLFVLIAAIAVVPEPMQLSNTKSSLFVYVFIKYSNNSIGFSDGCLSFAYLLLSILNSITDFGALNPEGSSLSIWFLNKP